MLDYWLYVPYEDEKGIVMPGQSPEHALAGAKDLGWSPAPGAEVYCYELGKLHSLYIDKVCHICDESYSAESRCDCEVEAQMDRDQ